MAEQNLMCLCLMVLVYFGFISAQGMNFTITPDSLIQDVQVDLSEKNCVLFQMRACSGSDGGANIYLTTQATNFNNYVYHFTLSFKKVTITPTDKSYISLIGDYSGFTLSCSQLNWYWISWRDGSIMLGMGQQPGVNSSLTFYDETELPSTIRYMGVSSINEATVYINLPAEVYDTTYCNFPASIDGSTEVCVGKDNVSFSQVTTKMDISYRTWIVFQAQASSDVYVYLLFNTNSEPAYTLTYRRINILSVIVNFITKNVFDDVAYNFQPKSPLTSSTLEWVWVSWNKGSLMAGQGQMVGRNVVMSYQDASPESTDNITLVQVGCAPKTSCTLRFSACYFLTDGCSPLAPRSEWKSKTTAPSTPILTLPVKKIIVHVTLTNECFTPEQCLKQVKAIETYHQQTHYTKLDEIAYNYLIGEDGRVYEGTGQHAGNHTKGRNDDSYGIAFIGEFKSRLPIDRALRAFQQLLSTSCVTDLGLNQGFTIAPHYDLDCTLCPNGPLKKWIEKTYQSNYVASSYKCRRGGYVHAVRK